MTKTQAPRNGQNPIWLCLLGLGFWSLDIYPPPVNPLLLLALGLAIVLGGILWLRLHPFLSLILGAFAVGGLTSIDNIEKSMAAKYHGDAFRSTINELVKKRIGESKEKDEVFDEQAIRKQVKQEFTPSEKENLKTTAQVRAKKYAGDNTTLSRITAAFGTTCGKIGILIAMACVIGRCLLASGAAERIVRGALSLVGERNAAVAFCGSAFVLGIPVFFDSLFLLAIPLVKATWLKVKKNYVLFVVALVAGGTMTHSLVPPTPGPLFVAEELGVNLGTMILVGMVIGSCCSAVGLVYANWINKRMNIPLRETPEAMKKLEELARRDINELPSLGLSLFPILLPVALISGVTIYQSGPDPTQEAHPILSLLGDKTVALTLAAAVAMLIAAVRLKDRKAVADHVQESMLEGGLIILICCAGGAFGAMLQQSGIGPFISEMTGDKPLEYSLLPLAFVVTAVIRGAQGSATVAMFTAVGIVASLVPDLDGLPFHPVYLAVAIGCGSKPFPWMNDSGFWVISKMSGMTEKETLKALTPMATLMGLTGIIITMIAARVIPMN